MKLVDTFYYADHVRCSLAPVYLSHPHAKMYWPRRDTNTSIRSTARLCGARHSIRMHHTCAIHILGSKTTTCKCTCTCEDEGRSWTGRTEFSNESVRSLSISLHFLSVCTHAFAFFGKVHWSVQIHYSLRRRLTNALSVQCIRKLLCCRLDYNADGK